MLLTLLVDVLSKFVHDLEITNVRTFVSIAIQKLYGMFLLRNIYIDYGILKQLWNSYEYLLVTWASPKFFPERTTNNVCILTHIHKNIQNYLKHSKSIYQKTIMIVNNNILTRNGRGDFLGIIWRCSIF